MGQVGEGTDRWRRIEEIFQVALDTTPDRRAAYLQRACGGDSSLRNEVESLLARDSEDSDTLAAIIDDTAASVLHDGAPQDAMDGAELGNYRIIR
jgi:hypothetical protein